MCSNLPIWARSDVWSVADCVTTTTLSVLGANAALAHGPCARGTQYSTGKDVGARRARRARLERRKAQVACKWTETQRHPAASAARRQRRQGQTEASGARRQRAATLEQRQQEQGRGTRRAETAKEAKSQRWRREKGEATKESRVKEVAAEGDGSCCDQSLPLSVGIFRGTR